MQPASLVGRRCFKTLTRATRNTPGTRHPGAYGPVSETCYLLLRTDAQVWLSRGDGKFTLVGQAIRGTGHHRSNPTKSTLNPASPEDPRAFKESLSVQLSSPG